MEEELLKGKALLIVDDEVDLRDIVASEFEFLGAKVFQAENIAKAQKILNQDHIDLIVSDIRMPGGTGIDLLDIVKAKNANTPPIMLITGFADITVEDAFNRGAEALVNKPFKLDDLIKMVKRYTSSFDERFVEPITSQKSITPFEVNPSVNFGRGGFSMEISPQGKRYDIGDAVNFDFEFDKKRYQGVAICRWLKVLDHNSQKTLIGVEFMNLTNQSREHFKLICQATQLVAYIPSAN